MSGPSVLHWTCAVPKAGGDEADYEDASAAATDRWPVCAAVADGATEAAFSGDWAERLVRGIVETDATTGEKLHDGLPHWQEKWRTYTQARAKEKAWYVSAKASEGAFAAVLGLSLHPDGQWRAVSVGDCCLFHVREGETLRSWPYDAPEAFTNRPALVPSRSAQGVPAPEETAGTWRASDRFLLASDAVAAWLLEAGPASLQARTREQARSRVTAARTEGALQNDDATLLVLEVSSSAGDE